MGKYLEAFSRSLFAIVAWTVFALVAIFSVSLLLTTFTVTDAKEIAFRDGWLTAALSLPAWFLALAVFNREVEIRWQVRLKALLLASVFVMVAVGIYEFALHAYLITVPTYTSASLMIFIVLVSVGLVVWKIPTFHIINSPSGSKRPKDIRIAELLGIASVALSLLFGILIYSFTLAKTTELLKDAKTAVVAINPELFVTLMLAATVLIPLAQLLAITRLGSSVVRGIMLFLFITGLWSAGTALFDSSTPMIGRVGSVICMAIQAYVLVLLYTKESTAWLHERPETLNSTPLPASDS